MKCREQNANSSPKHRFIRIAPYARRWWTGWVALLCMGALAQADPTVTIQQLPNQRAGTRLVEMPYQLAATGPCTVSIRISSDGGSTWTVPANTFVENSHIGSGIAAGNKLIVWDAGEDWDGQWSDRMRVEITATLSQTSDEFIYVQGGTLPDIGNGVITVASFSIGKYEVTDGTWFSLIIWAIDNGYGFDSGGAYGCASSHPMHRANWYDCVKWCNARSQKEGRMPVYTVDGAIYKSGEHDDVAVNAAANGYRLPTDAEWEFAARGGIHSQGYEYSGGNDVNAVAWYRENIGGAECYFDEGWGTWPVGQKAANELRIHDMSGNVAEWCFDWHPNYVGSRRVVRGGGWRNGADNCRVGSRTEIGPYYYYDNVGFRAVLPPVQP